MSDTQQANRDQAELWNETAGHNWVEMQSVLDEVLAPFEKLLIEHALSDGTRHLLDIGCGSGSTTLAAARRLRKGGSSLGADISAPLIEAARKRALQEGLDNASFVQADAQTHAFEAGRFDAAISRLGVMFFDDPVAAFANIRRGMRSGGLLAFVAWRSPEENPFMTTAARAAAPYLPSLPKPDPNGPGQFGFADPDRVRRILEASGWHGIDLQPIDVTESLSETNLSAYVTKMGPVTLALKDVDEQTRVKVNGVVRAAFNPFIRDGMARFNMACWLVKARG
jgi:SAM-dependent methyltransferase